jgi:DNA-binding NarL/FixJ family response regulator
VRQAVEAGAVGFVPKESSPEVMTAALTLAISGGVYLPLAALGQVGTAATPAGAATMNGAGLIAAAPAHPAAATTAPLRELAEVFPDLTERHRTVLGLLARGMSNKGIARVLDITEGTVKQHVSAIFREMDVASRTEAVYLLATRGVRFE